MKKNTTAAGTAKALARFRDEPTLCSFSDDRRMHHREETLSDAIAFCNAHEELVRCLSNLEKELQRAFDDVPAGVDAWMAESRTCLAELGEAP